LRRLFRNFRDLFDLLCRNAAWRAAWL
jgi:hypothetical protein